MQSTEYINFRQYLLTLRRRWLPATVIFTSVIVLTTLYTFWQKPIYEAKGKLLIRKPNNVTSALTEGNVEQGKLSPIGRESDPLSTEAELIRSTKIAHKTIATFNLKLKPKEFLQQLHVQSVKGTDILEISYQSPDPQTAAAVVNAVISLYLENNFIANRTEAAAAHEFIAVQLPKTKVSVHQAEVALRRFEEENHVADLEEEAKSALEVIADLEKQKGTAQAKLADANSQTEVLRKNLSGMNVQQAIAASSTSQTPGVQKVLEELQQVESQLVIARTNLQEAHPTIAKLKSKKASLETLLRGRVEQVVGVQQQQPKGSLQLGQIKQQITNDLVRLEAERLGWASQVNALSKVLASYKQRMNVLPRLKQQKRELERELEAAQATYETLLRRLEEIRVEENRNIGNARLAEKAEVPEEPVALNKARNLAIGGLLGILLAIGTALLLEELDTSIKTVKEARRVFNYTLLGVIPFLGKSEQPIPHDGYAEQYDSKILAQDLTYSPISEAYRMLQANLKFLSSDKALQVIVVTSSVPKEGKSTVSANLAVAIAQLERRVLLVDGDMRHPSQHHIWELTNAAGLSDVIVGQVEFKAAVTELTPNLDVLTSGVIPPNSMALLDSKRMVSLVEYFSKHYEFVIIDTPPLNANADAAILGKMADGVLLVARPEVINSVSAAAAKEFLEQSGQNVLGLVVNGAILQNESDRYFYYGQGYHTVANSKTQEGASL